MVIEDEVMLLQAIAKKLETAGIESVLCTSGKQAIDYLHSLPRLPDLIWLDFYLRDMDGGEFMTEFKKNDSWAKVPVLVVSNSASVEKVKLMRELGVVDYLVKSDHGLAEVLEIVKKYVNTD